MKKATRNYIVDLVMFVLIIVEAISGFVIWIVFPRGGGYMGGRGSGLVTETSFLRARDTWIALHNWAAVALVVVVVLHLILHWKWVVHMTKKLFK